MEKLKQLREDAGLTQEAMADVIGITQATLSRYEDGTRQPRPKIAMKICDIFKGKIQFNDIYDLPTPHKGAR